MQEVAQQNRQELEKLLLLVCCLAGPKAIKEQYWIELFRFLDRAMPTDTADCSLEQLAEDAFTALTYTEQVQWQSLLYSFQEQSVGTAHIHVVRLKCWACSGVLESIDSHQCIMLALFAPVWSLI